jgi:hypothetical protein
MYIRRVALLVVSAVVGLTVTAAAQRVVAGGSKGTSKVQAKTVTITGCVAQGIDADHYVLANAVHREQPASSHSKAGRSLGPYDLQGGEFKAHLGHTVEVTGTNGSTATAANARTSDPAREKKPLPAFNVLSVKMLSATCA